MFSSQLSFEFIKKYLPNPPCSLLIAGINFDSQGLTHGYSITSLNDSLLKGEEGIAVLTKTLPTRYDALLLRMTCTQNQLLALFNTIHQLLVPSGTAVIIIPVDKNRSLNDSLQEMPLLTYLIAQAQRCGLQWVTSIENIENAAPEEVLLQLTSIATPRWQLQVVTVREREAVHALFNEVFQPKQMTSALWDWKYGNGRGLGIAAWHEGKMVAHYGGVLREIRYLGHPKLAIQITDVMVAAKERGVFKRQGAFFLTTATFLENYIGYGARAWLGYGFPSYRHVKLAQNLGLYAPVGEVVELRWHTLTARPHWWVQIRLLSVQSEEAIRKLINLLWERMAIDLQNALVAVRDGNYVQRRYLAHPHNRYEFALIRHRFTRQPLAIVVIYRTENMCRIMDYIGALVHLPIAIYQVRRLASLWGVQEINMWITRNFVSICPLQQAEQHALDIYVPHNIWSPCFPPEDIKERWWLMAGDTDFL